MYTSTTTSEILLCRLEDGKWVDPRSVVAAEPHQGKIRFHLSSGSALEVTPDLREGETTGDACARMLNDLALRGPIEVDADDANEDGDDRG